VGVWNRKALNFAAGVIVRRFAGVGVPSEARLAGVIERTDVTIYAFSRALPEGRKKQIQYMGPYVAS